MWLLPSHDEVLKNSKQTKTLRYWAYKSQINRLSLAREREREGERENLCMFLLQKLYLAHLSVLSMASTSDEEKKNKIT